MGIYEPPVPMAITMRPIIGPAILGAPKAGIEVNVRMTSPRQYKHETYRMVL